MLQSQQIEVLFSNRRRGRGCGGGGDGGEIHGQVSQKQDEATTPSQEIKSSRDKLQTTHHTSHNHLHHRVGKERKVCVDPTPQFIHGHDWLTEQRGKCLPRSEDYEPAAPQSASSNLSWTFAITSWLVEIWEREEKGGILILERGREP